jgi:hypothetical protein
VAILRRREDPGALVERDKLVHSEGRKHPPEEGVLVLCCFSLWRQGVRLAGGPRSRRRPAGCLLEPVHASGPSRDNRCLPPLPLRYLTLSELIILCSHRGGRGSRIWGLRCVRRPRPLSLVGRRVPQRLHDPGRLRYRRHGYS